MHAIQSTNADMASATPRQKLLLAIEEVAARHGVTLKDIMSRSRYGHIVRARNEAYYVVWLQFQSLPRTGALFGRDHSMIAYGIGSHMILNNLGKNWMTELVHHKRAVSNGYHPARRAA